MKKFLLSLIALLTLVSIASATTYYVRPGGGDGQVGTSYNTAWRTIAKANTATLPGDIVRVYESQSSGYAEIPNPDSAGHSTDDKFITFIGTSLDGDPLTSVSIRDRIKLPSGTISTNHLVIKGVTFSGDLDLGGNRDSVLYSTVVGSLDWSAANYTFFGHNHVNGSAFQGDGCNPTASAPYFCQIVGPYIRGNTFSDNHFTALFSGGSLNQFTIIGADSCSFLFNTFDIDNWNGDYPTYYFNVKHASRIVLRGNRWNYNKVYAGGDNNYYAVGLCFRDSVSYLEMHCDTLWQNTPEDAPLRWEFSAEGNNNPRTVTNLTVDSCTFISNGGFAWWESGLVTTSFTYNTVISKASPAFMTTDGAHGPNLISNNTFVGYLSAQNYPSSYDSRLSIFEFMKGGSGYPGYPRWSTLGVWSDTTRVQNNIFYAITEFTTGEPYIPGAAAVKYYPIDYDSTYYYTRSSHASSLITDHNLYSYYGHTNPDTVGKVSISWHDGDYTRYTWPGTHASLHGLGADSDSLNLVAGVFADTVTVTAGVFADTVSIVAGAFEDSITVTLPAYLPLADSTFKIAVVRTVKTPPSDGKLPVMITTVTPPSSGKLPIVRTEKTPPSSGIIPLTITYTPGAFLPNTPWSEIWCPGCDDSSRYGSPLFLDSTRVTFNPGLSRYSLARYGGKDSVDIGAIIYTSLPMLEVIAMNLGFEAFSTSGNDSAFFECYNRGEADSLRITGVVIVDPDAEANGEFSFSATSGNIGPDRSLGFRVNYDPYPQAEPLGRYRYTVITSVYLLFSTNDPLNPTFQVPIKITIKEG
jgi:hypothetical protein